MANVYNFVDKTALVTGAGSGIGRAVAVRLIELGADVIAIGQTQSKLDDLREELKDKGSQIKTICVDLGNWQEAESKLIDVCRKVDFLINNAGCAYNSKVEDVAHEELNKVIDINLKAPINLIKMVTQGMKERKFGSIVNVSSVAGIVGLPEHVCYGSSKAALDMVTKVSALELAPHGIRVNSVNPTVIWTPLSAKHWSEPERKAAMISKIPMGRFGEIQEVVGPIIFLLSDQASFVSGTLMPIDGGFVAT